MRQQQQNKNNDNVSQIIQRENKRYLVEYE